MVAYELWRQERAIRNLPFVDKNFRMLQMAIRVFVESSGLFLATYVVFGIMMGIGSAGVGYKPAGTFLVLVSIY